MEKIPCQLLIMSLGGWLLFLVGSTILGFSWSEYDSFANTISGLASVIAPTRFVMDTIFLIDGFVLIIYGKKLNDHLLQNKKQVGTGHFIMVSGLMLNLLIVFPGGVAMGVNTPTQIPHIITAVFLVVSFIIAPFIFYIRMRKYPDWRQTLTIIMVITGFKIVNYMGSIIVVFLEGRISEFAGLFQKLGFAFDATWMVILSVQLIRLKVPVI